MEVEGGHKNELIDLETICLDTERTCSLVPSKPLLPVPASPLGVCVYGVNPFDQLMDLTRKSSSNKDDPFEMVYEKAFGSGAQDLNSKASKVIYSDQSYPRLSQSQTKLEKCQVVKTSVNDANAASEINLSEGLVISGKVSINPPSNSTHLNSDLLHEDSTFSRKEHKPVSTAKLVDLPSPMFIRNCGDGNVPNQVDRSDIMELKCNNSTSCEGSNVSKANFSKLVLDDCNKGVGTSNASRNSELCEPLKSKLVDLQSPVSARTSEDTVELEKAVHANDTTEVKHNPEASEESNTSNTNTSRLVPENNSNEFSHPSTNRRNSTSHEKVKAIIAERVEKCIEKALNDSRKLFRSGSATDLNFTESKPQLAKHRRSYSSGLLGNFERNAEKESSGKSFTGDKNNVPWLLGSNVSSNDKFNIGFRKSSSVSSRFSKSFDDLYTDITNMNAKFNWKESPCNGKETLTDMPIWKQATAQRPTDVEAFNTSAVYMEDYSTSSVFVEALSMSVILEKAAGIENNVSLENVKPPWKDENFEEIRIEIEGEDLTPNGNKQLKQTICSGYERLKSDDSKVLSDSSLSFETSILMNPMTHSTPVIRRDMMSSVLRGEAKISPLLPFVPVLNSSPKAVTQKLRPLRNVLEQEVKKGPLKAIAPVVTMTRNVNKEEIATVDGAADTPGKDVATTEQSTSKITGVVTKSMTENEKLKSTPPSCKIKANGSSSNKKLEKNEHLLRRAVSANSASPKLPSNPIGSPTPVGSKSRKILSKMGVTGRGRSRSYDIKESPKAKASKEPMQKSRSATSVVPLQPISGKNLVSKNANKISKDLKTAASNQHSPKISNNAYTAVRKVVSKLKISVSHGKENIVPKN